MKRIAVAMRERTRQHDSQLVTGNARGGTHARVLKSAILTLSFWIVVAVAIFWTPASSAQALTGDLVGTVTDANGAVIPNAKVTVLNADTQQQRAMTTSSTGDYVFTLLQPGTYTIRVEQKRYKSHEVRGVKLTAGDKMRIDAQLSVGEAAETVTVNADTLPVLQTDSSTVQDVVGEQAVQDLPLNGRNLESAVQLTAGVNAGSPSAISGGARPDDRRPGYTFVANGQSDLANDNLVDGLDNNEREQGFSGIHPSIDSIAEVRVLTNNYSADLGRTGGAVVNIITKGGSNQFHGSAYEFFRNDIFDAKDKSYNGTSLAKAEYRQNIFGGSLGGPIVKDKTFFFADIESNRNIQGENQTSSVPTLYEEQHPGDFTDNPFETALVPSGSINPIGLAYFKMYPAPNSSGFANNYTSQFKKTQYSTSTDDRIDHRFSANDSIFVRFGYNPVNTYIPEPLPNVQVDGSTLSPGGASYAGPSATTATNLQANYVHLFNSNLIMELKTGYTRINIETNPPNHGVDWASKLGFTNTYTTPDALGLPYMWMLGGDYSSLGDGIFIPIYDVNNTYQYNGSVNYTRANHSFKVGGAIARRELNYFQDEFSPQGGFGFLALGIPGLGEYFNGAANMLAGVPYGVERGADLAHQGLRSWEPNVYINDDWHARPWLTLNLGVRWETFTPITDAHNQYSNFDMTSLKVLIAGQGTDSRGGVATDYSDFSPRVGFDIDLGHEAVLRGGFGMSYYPTVMQTQIQNVNPPYSYVCVFCQTPSFPDLPTPTSSATDPVGTVSSEAKDLKNAYVRQYNLIVQKAFGATSISVGGVGTQGRRALYMNNPDLPLPAGEGNPKPGYVYAAQLPLVTDIQRIENTGITNYFALQTVITRQMTKGLAVNANYTWAHGLSNSIQSASSTTNAYALITNNPMYDYGNSPIDVRHRIAGSLIYDLPFAKSQTGFVGRVAGGWQAALMGFWQTGIPFTVTDGAAAINLPGITSDRPNQTGSATLSHPGIGKFFDTTAFKTQTVGTAGNEASDSVYGPRARVLNASLLKDFELHERLKLQFRSEFFNITNTANWAQPGNVLSTPATFGVISATAANSTPRQMQFALKLLF